MNKYDYLIVGSGLYGAVFARKALDAGKTVLVVEKRDHIGGNVYTKDIVLENERLSEEVQKEILSKSDYILSKAKD